MDKNIINRGLDFVKNYGKDSSLALDIVLFSSLKYQKNLFDFEDLDPVEFANTMGYHVTHLYEPVKYGSLKDPNAPLCLKSNDPLIKHSFINVIGDMLYRMSTEPMVFSKKVCDKSTGDDYIEVEAYQLIRKLRRHNYKRKDKFIYSFIFNETLRLHMNMFFSQLDIESLKNLRRPKAAFLYMKLVELQDLHYSGKTEKIVPNFNYLCDQAQINIKYIPDRKKRLCYKLDLVKERSNLDFDKKFFRLNGKYDYGVEIIFNSKRNPEEKNKILSEAFESALYDNLKIIFKELYNIGAKENINKFQQWIKDPRYDYGHKENCYIATYSQIKNIDIRSAEVYTRMDRRIFFNNQ